MPVFSTLALPALFTILRLLNSPAHCLAESVVIEEKGIGIVLMPFYAYVPESAYLGSNAQTRYMAPHVKPAPKAVITILSPFFSLFLYSSRHNGIDAAEVLP